MTEPTTFRLNKHLALQLAISRREADELIEREQVTVNGTVVTLGARFSEGDEIAVKGTIIGDQTAYRYILLNKPTGYVCSRRDQGDAPTIYAILPPGYQAFKPVGRLDKDSSGLILLSNDGDFAYRMTHPKFNKVKVYTVELDHELAPLHQQMISDYGVQLEDGLSKFTVVREQGKRYEITMHEGRNRQIRRTFGALGYTVTALHRTQFGNYSLDDMKSGEYKNITIQ
jgi:23S rRNA pseudouridine2605 synthase